MGRAPAWSGAGERVVLACAALVLALWWSGCVPGTGRTLPELREAVDWPEADRLFRRDRHWVGGDGAYSIDLGRGRVLWLFGDSWIDPEGQGDRSGAVMVSNAVAIQHGYDPSAARAEFFWGGSGPEGPLPFFPDFGDGKYWPGHGVRIGDTLLLFLMEVRPSGTGLGFSVSGWRTVLVGNPDDSPADWRLAWPRLPEAPRGVVVGSGGVLRSGEHLYAFGAREPGPGQDVYLARWPEEDAALGRLERPEWWAGPGRGWATAAQESPVPVFGDGQSEFTVHRDPGTGVFHEYQTDGFGAAVVIRRTAAAPEGPWSRKDTVYVPPEGRFSRVLIYQGKAHPHLRGAELVLTYSTNSTELGDHFREPWLYYPRFVRLGRSGGSPHPGPDRHRGGG